jgi:hypothetical protein
MTGQAIANISLDELTADELKDVSGGAALGPNGVHATGVLEAMSVLDGSRGKVMVIVDGVIMNKDELGMI